jgi:hypothetical protein
MQTRWQSTVEVATDLVFSVLINVGGQLVFYQTFATMGRVTLFTGLVLGLACVRRFVIRRFFETLVPTGMRQPHWQSGLESMVDTVLGFAIGVVLQMLIYPETATLLHASSLTFLIYGLAMLRRYLLRRVFAAWAMRTTPRQDVHDSGEELSGSSPINSSSTSTHTVQQQKDASDI